MNKSRKQSDSTYPLLFLMVDSTDHVTGKTGLSPTVTISKNGGSFASPSGAVSEVGNGLYKVAGNTTDSNTVGELWIHATGTGADPTDTAYTVVPYDPFDSVRLGLTALPNAAAEAAGGLYTRGSGAGQINQPANGQIDANTVKVSGTTQTARDIGASVLLSSGTGTGQIDFTSGVVKSNMTQIDGLATNGNNATFNLKQFNVINSSGDATVFSSTGGSGRGMALLGNSTGFGLDVVGGGIAAGARFLGNGGSSSIIASQGITGTISGAVVTSISNNAVTAASLAADAGAEIANTVWGTPRPGTPTAGTYGDGVLVESLNGTAKAQVNVEVKDVMETDTQAEPAGVPLAASSFKDKVGWIFARLRNKQKLTKASGVEVIYADDSVTPIGTSTDTDDTVTFTKGKMS